MRCWALTGPGPTRWPTPCDEALAVPAPTPQVVQELHLVSVHVLCECVDRCRCRGRPRRARVGVRRPPLAALPTPDGDGA